MIQMKEGCKIKFPLKVYNQSLQERNKQAKILDFNIIQ